MRSMALSAFLALAVVSVGASFGAAQTLQGAGATFPQPLYEVWFEAYEQLEGVSVSYAATGSGSGIDALLARTVDFGATDAYLTDAELRNAPSTILHVPTCLGAVVVTYNLPGIPELRFTPELLSEIFLGRITTWTDRRIAAVNPGLRFPDEQITVVHRSDASGTTLIFSDFLADSSLTWREAVGRGRAVEWPVGLGEEGNVGVVERVRTTPGAIGYVAHIYAENSQLPTASVRNRESYYVKPTLDTMTAAARVPLPDDSRIMLTNSTAPDGYPITGMTYLIVYQEQSYSGRSRARAQALVDLLWWITHEGQVLTEDEAYAPLPVNAVQRAETAIGSMTYDGRLLATP